MFNSVNNKLINISNGCPNQRTALMLINDEINIKNSEKRKKRKSHPLLWEENKRKLMRNSVCF